MTRHVVRPFLLALLLPAALGGQVIPLKTVPIPSGEQFLLAPSANLGLAGVSVALDDAYADPFANPARGMLLGANEERRRFPVAEHTLVCRQAAPRVRLHCHEVDRRERTTLVLRVVAEAGQVPRDDLHPEVVRRLDHLRRLLRVDDRLRLAVVRRLEVEGADPEVGHALHPGQRRSRMLLGQRAAQGGSAEHARDGADDRPEEADEDGLDEQPALNQLRRRRRASELSRK
mgnify:CR=1 FL=1